MKKEIKYPGCFYCDNIIDYPEHFGLLHLDFPRCFIVVRNMEEFLYTDYQGFRKAVADIQWLDKDADSYSESEKEEVIVRLWNFSVEQEGMEDEMFKNKDW